MKLQKNTLVLLFLALCLGVYTLATQNRASESGVATEPATEAESPTEAIFSIAEAELAALTIERGDDTETIRLVKSNPVAEPTVGGNGGASATDGSGDGGDRDSPADAVGNDGGDGDGAAADAIAGESDGAVADVGDATDSNGDGGGDGDNAADDGGDGSGDGDADSDRDRNGDGDGDAQSAWSMETPEEGPVSAAAVAFLVDLLLVKPEAGLHSFEVEPELLEEYGLAEPSATLSLELQDGDRRQLVLGNPSFEGQSLYARLDPERDGEATKVKVLLVNADLQSAIERPVGEWLEAEAEAEAEADEADREDEEPES